jgi:hypothetical protein
VHSLGSWEGAYDEINAWEERLIADGTTILKMMLHISREEQARRLLDRLDDPTKHWKYDPADVDERAHWDDYQAAYQDALVRCSTPEAPWHVIPANRKWHRDWLLSHLLVETLESIPAEWPSADFDPEVEKAARSSSAVSHSVTNRDVSSSSATSTKTPRYPLYSRSQPPTSADCAVRSARAAAGPRIVAMAATTGASIRTRPGARRKGRGKMDALRRV